MLADVYAELPTSEPSSTCNNAPTKPHSGHENQIDGHEELDDVVMW